MYSIALIEYITFEMQGNVSSWARTEIQKPIILLVLNADIFGKPIFLWNTRSLVDVYFLFIYG